MSYPAVLPRFQTWISGAPNSSGTMEFRDSDDNTLLSVYGTAADADAQTNALVNPVALDAYGGATVFLEDGITYRMICKSSAGATLWTQDDVSVGGATVYKNVKSFDVKGDGVTDDTVAIQAVIDSLSGGGVAYFPAGTYAYSTTLSNPYSNVVLLGEGADRSHDTGGQNTLGTTTFKWIGAANGVMVDIYSPSGASNQKMVGCGVQRIHFNCNSKADYAIKIRSQAVGIYEQIHVNEPGVAAVYLGMMDTLGDARDTNHNRFSQISARCVVNSSSLFVLEGDTDATPTANVSINYFENCYGIYKDGDCYDIRNADHNFFNYCRAFRTTLGTGNGIVFNGTNTAGGQVARHNVFWNYGGAGGPIVGRGTETHSVVSYDNSVLYADKGNSTPDPTVETGSSIHYSTDEAITWTPGFTQATFSNSSAKAKSERDNLGTESARFHNGASNHTRWLDNSGNEFGLNITGGDFRFNNASGGGGFYFNADIGFHGTLPQSKPTVTGSRGANAALASLLTQLAAYGLITDSSS